MKTEKEYTIQGIEAEIVNPGIWYYVQINRVWEKADGKRSDEPILRFEKCFSTTEHAKAFMTTKAFKAVFKAIEKCQNTINQ